MHETLCSASSQTQADRLINRHSKHSHGVGLGLRRHFEECRKYEDSGSFQRNREENKRCAKIKQMMCEVELKHYSYPVIAGARVHLH